VAVDPARPCGHCAQCLRGYRNLCPNVVFAGHGDCDGGLQQRIAWPTSELFALPEAFDGIDGAILEPLGVAIHAIDLAQLRLGMDILIVGAGPIGMLLARLARLSGAHRVFVSEPLEHRRTVAVSDADGAWHPADLPPALAEATSGRGVDRVIEMAGNDAAIGDAVDAARPGARVVLGGIPSDDRSSFVASAARRKGLTFAMVRRMNDVYPRAIALARGKNLALDTLVTARFGIDDAAVAFRHAAGRSGMKTIIRPSFPDADGFDGASA
jgi:L-iditol 2-dehydrogenase